MSTDTDLGLIVPKTLSHWWFEEPRSPANRTWTNTITVSQAGMYQITTGSSSIVVNGLVVAQSQSYQRTATQMNVSVATMGVFNLEKGDLITLEGNSSVLEIPTVSVVDTTLWTGKALSGFTPVPQEKEVILDDLAETPSLDLSPELQDALDHLTECGGVMAQENLPGVGSLIAAGLASAGGLDKFGRKTVHLVQR